jgi:AcrR family transcriptional regulator
MDTRKILVAAALKILEQEGEAQFSTRAVCTIANVTAPTLYHHFGNADGLVSAAITAAFAQFLQGKTAALTSRDPVTALGQGWDNYVDFAAARPRLYAAMLGRILKGSPILAAEQGFALLKSNIAAIAAEGRLAGTVAAGADLIWASATAAALLHLMARLREAAPPEPSVIDSLRHQAMQALLTPKPKITPQPKRKSP